MVDPTKSGAETVLHPKTIIITDIKTGQPHFEISVLQRKYLDEGLSLKQISKEFRIPKTTLLSTLREAKTPIRADTEIGKVGISTKGTVLNFPVKPSKVVLGRPGSFAIEYVESDLAITPLSLASRSNLFVYMAGRRFNFDLIASPNTGSSIVIIKDSKDFQMRIEK